MSEEIRKLNPQAIWSHFADLNTIPRASKKEDRVIRFIKDFGARLGFETFEDEVRNVIIRKPATAGMEHRKTIVLQSHLDMVHQKNSDTVFDFDTEGIRMMVDGEWVRARGTTLGADNGIGVAAIMAILESKDIPHPAMEALFTIDEETGMTGALGLKGGILKSEILLNLDTENDNEIDIGCAGGLDVTAVRKYVEEDTPATMKGYKLAVSGLRGGHSGMDIHKGLGNANKIMNRLLYGACNGYGCRIAAVDGGSLRNAIPRESQAWIALPAELEHGFLEYVQHISVEIKSELRTIEPGLAIDILPHALPAKVMSIATQEQMLRAVYAAHDGVYRMSAEIPGLVETSNNVAKVSMAGGEALIACLTRSAVESSKMDLAEALRASFALADCEVTFSNSYPGWTPNVQSPILKVLVEVYEKLHGHKPEVVACHAGLECGILGRNYPGMDMISFGPTILAAHSPDERVSISSVAKFWDYLKEILAAIPVGAPGMPVV